MPIQNRNLSKALQSVLEAGGGGEEHYIYSSGTAAPYSYQRTKREAAKLHSTLALAHTAMTTHRNDQALLSPENHSLAATLTWSKSLTHLVGDYPPGMMNHRARIGHSANFTPFMTVSGYGNTFENLYMMHGRGSATNLVGLNITGNRNTFRRCHIAGPLHTTEGDEAGYTLIQLDAAETSFEECVIGIDTTAFTAAGCLVKFGNAVEPPRSTFKDCIFLMNADAAAPFFFNVEAGAGAGLATFQNCLMVNIGTAIDYGINGAGLGNFKMFFDINCSFGGTSDIVAAAKESNIMVGHGGYVSADLLNNLIATKPDVS